MNERSTATRRTLLSLIAVLVVALVAGAALLLWPTPSDQGPETTPEAGWSLVTVKRENLKISTSLEGKLGYGRASEIPLQASGVVTWLPDSGSLVGRGQALLKVDNRPVVVMYGDTPAYRAMYDTRTGTTDGDDASTSDADPASGSDRTTGNGKANAPPATPAPPPPPLMSGPDVAQLEQNLAALGFGGFTIDEEFTPYTAAAVKRWQSALGIPVTGRVELGEVVFLPGQVRVATDRSTLGTSDISTAVKATSAQKVVTVTGPADSLAWATEGARVSILLPNQKKTPGTVTSVSGSENGDMSARISLARPGQANDSGSVTVTYVSRRENDALTVPVTALVALAEGGYGLQLQDGSYVPVTPGIYSGGVVQITGDIQPGTEVRDAS